MIKSLIMAIGVLFVLAVLGAAEWWLIENGYHWVLGSFFSVVIFGAIWLSCYTLLKETEPTQKGQNE